MPGVVVFKRILPLASDDFLAPSFIGMLFHITWIALDLILLIRYPTECDMLLNYLIVSLLFQILGSFLNILAIYTTLQGTVCDESPRRLMPLILIMNVGIKFPELAVHIYAALVYFGSDQACSPPYFRFLISATSFMTGGIVILFIITIMTLLASTPHELEAEDTHRHIRRAISPLFVVPHLMHRSQNDIEGHGSVKQILGEIAKLLSIIIRSY